MKSLLAAALAATALTMPAMVEAQESGARAISGTRLDLQAQGEVRVKPDIAVINAGVVTQAPDAARAMQDNAARMARVVAALKAKGIADKDMQTQSISLSPQYRYVNNEPPVITGYQANNTLTVKFRDIGKAGAVLDTLVKEGANQIDGPSLVIEDPAAAQDAARLAAFKTLRARAELYAKAAGLRVVRIIQMSESSNGMPTPMPMMMARMADAAPAEKTSIEAGEQSVGMTLSAVFELQ